MTNLPLFDLDPPVKPPKGAKVISSGDVWEYGDNEQWSKPPRYPAIAGHQRAETSEAAAVAIERKGRAASLREKCLALLEAESLTADECAERLGENPLSVRPRVAELNKQGLLMDTGGRRPSSMNTPMAVWSAKTA